MRIELQELVFVMLVLLVGRPAAADDQGSSYGEIIKNTPEYKQVTEKRHRERRNSDDDDVVIVDEYIDYGTDSDYTGSGNPDSDMNTRMARPSGLYLGLMIGSSSFEYDDVDDADAEMIYVGLRPLNDWLGYELTYFDTGDAEVSSLSGIVFRVEALDISLTYNSAKYIDSRWNIFGSAGIYLANSTLSGPYDDVTDDSNGFSIGGGITYSLRDRFQLRLDARRLYDVEDFANDGSITIVGFGGQVFF